MRAGLLALSFAAALAAQEPPLVEPLLAPAEEAVPADLPAPGSAEAIRAATTDPRFLPEPVRDLPDGGPVPSPGAFLGRLAGGPGAPATSDAIERYLRALDEASDRVAVVPIGRTEEGKEILLAAISESANLAALDTLRLIGARLADPRVTPAEEAASLTAEGKVFYLLWSGARATDLAAPEALAELAFRLAVSERPETRTVRREMVVLLVPLLDPDARDRAVAWYERNLRGRRLPPAALAELGAPPVEGAFAADDGDKDGLGLALAPGRALQNAFFTYLPQVVHELADGDRPFVTSDGAPAGPAVALPREAAAELASLAAVEVETLAAWGVPAAGLRATRDWDAWWPGRLGAVAGLHNALPRRTSVLAAPVLDPQTLVAEGSPIAWTGRNSVNLGQAAALVSLWQAAIQRGKLLAGHHARAARAVEAGKSTPPHAFALPAGEAAGDRLALLLEGLAAQRIKGGRLPADLEIDGRRLPAGTVVVRLDQPYRAAALALLGEPAFPGPGTPEAAGWSWPWLFDVPALPIADPRILEAPLAFDGAAPAGEVGGVGEDLFLLADTGQAGLLRARVLLGPHQVDAAEVPFRAAGRDYPRGSWIVQAPRAAVAEVARQTGLAFTGVAVLPDVRRHIVDLPRLGLYVPWIDTRGAGWARLALERAGLPHTVLTDADLRAGNLRERLDVLLLPDVRAGLVRQLHGFDPRGGPWTSVGGAGTPAGAEVSGGFGLAGLTALERFVRDGGTLLTLGRAALLPLAAGLVRGLDVPATDDFLLGSELAAVNLAPGHPLTYGYGERVSLFVDGGAWLAGREAEGVLVRFGLTAGAAPRPRPVAASGTEIPELTEAEPPGGPLPGLFEVEDLSEEAEPAARPAAAAAWRDIDRPVLAGAARDGELAAGRPALVDLPVGSGRVVAFAFDPFARALPVSDLRFVYNALLHWNDLPQEP